MGIFVPRDDGFLQVVPGPDGVQCDFCDGTAKPHFRYACQSFAIEADGEIAGIPVSMSEGDWCACAACKPLIDTERWDELARRSAEGFIAKNPQAASHFDAIYEHCRQVHQQFRQMRRNTQ